MAQSVPTQEPNLVQFFFRGDWLSQQIATCLSQVLSHRHIVLDTVFPELRCRKPFSNDDGSSEQQGLTYAHHSPCHVVQGQRIVENVVLLHLVHVVHSICSHHKSKISRTLKI